MQDYSIQAGRDKPRIFLGSSGKQAKLVQALTRGLEDIAHVEPWTTSFNPGTTTIERLLELTHEVDFAAFVFARDDWTTSTAVPSAESGQASPRDNVIFEAGLFGGVLGMRRTFILHAKGAKLPTDLLGLTCIRYGNTETAAEMQVVNEKIRHAIESYGHVARIEGIWWQFSLTERSIDEPSAVSLLRISRDRTGALEVAGRSWREDGTLSARYWAKRQRANSTPGSSTTSRANAPRNRTRHLLRVRARSSLSPPIALPGISPPGRTRIRTSMRVPLVFTCAPTLATSPSSMEATTSSAPNSSQSDWSTGRRSRTPELRISRVASICQR